MSPIPKDEIYIWISTHFASGGLVVRNGVVRDCPPIFKKWFIGKSLEDALDTLQRNGGTYRILNNA